MKRSIGAVQLTYKTQFPVSVLSGLSSLIDGIGYPGITLAGGQSTGIIDLATISLSFFDPSLTYPGV